MACDNSACTWSKVPGSNTAMNVLSTSHIEEGFPKLELSPMRKNKQEKTPAALASEDLNSPTCQCYRQVSFSLTWEEACSLANVILSWKSSMKGTTVPSLEPKTLHPAQPASLQPHPGQRCLTVKPVPTDRGVFALKCVDINAKQLGTHSKRKHHTIKGTQYSSNWPKEMEIFKLSDKEFKRIILRKLSKIKEHTDRLLE